MSHDCVFTSRRTSVVVVGLGLIGVFLFRFFSLWLHMSQTMTSIRTTSLPLLV